MSRSTELCASTNQYIRFHTFFYRNFRLGPFFFGLARQWRIGRERKARQQQKAGGDGPGPGWQGKMKVEGQPEEPIQNNVGRIGNLMLLPTVLKSEAKARPFSEKKVIYERHRLRMIAEVTAKADWTLQQIQEREATITTWAKERWKDI